ncbi:MAG: FkbM family methyltransferase, partial [Desulfobacteraceae bacterium]
TREKDTIRVDIATLDDIFLDRTLDRPVLLKIDVQGSEKDVIAGGQETLKNVDYVLMEVSFDTMYVGEASFLEIVKEMETLHFQFSHPIAILKSPNSGKILQADILFVNTNPIVA